MTLGEAFPTGTIGNTALKVVAPRLQATLNNDVERSEQYDFLGEEFLDGESQLCSRSFWPHGLFF